jgi:hypothetical protein
MIEKIIFGRNNWLKAYKSKKENCHLKTWIVCNVGDDKEFFLLSNNKVSMIKEYCNANNFQIRSIGLKYRSHEIKFEEHSDEGYYIVKSVKGSMGVETKHCIVLGAIRDGKVYKKAYIVPELIVLYEDVDDIEKCFEEALIYNDKKKNRKKQI